LYRQHPASEQLDIVAICRGSISVNKELGFSSLVVLDADHAVAQSFRVSGTLAAVLIGAEGTVAPGVARGVAVRAYVDRCHLPEMMSAQDQTDMP